MKSEDKTYGIHLILGLLNYWNALGGKKQFVAWARQRRQNTKIVGYGIAF